MSPNECVDVTCYDKFGREKINQYFIHEVDLKKNMASLKLRMKDKDVVIENYPLSKIYLTGQHPLKYK